MLISCDCSIDVDSFPDICNESIKTARKQHVCCECSRAIKPKEKYHIVTGLWEHEWSTFKTCLGCSRIRNHFCKYGFIFGNLAEQIEECIGFNYLSDEMEE